MRDRINSMVKKKENFRHFASAVLKECMSDHFDMKHSFTNYAFTCDVTAKIEFDDFCSRIFVMICI